MNESLNNLGYVCVMLDKLNQQDISHSDCLSLQVFSHQWC